MKVYEPVDDYADVSTGIVMFNQFGATASQDTGRDAESMANALQLPVISVDRPGTGSLVPHRGLVEQCSDPDDYLVLMSKIGQKVDERVESLGLSRVITTGRSAGGLGALALARTETVSNLSAIFAAEPVGWEQLSLKAGLKRYVDYLKWQKEFIKTSTDEELVKPLPPGLSLFPAIGRMLSIPPAALIDRYHNKGLFASNAALKYAGFILPRN